MSDPRELEPYRTDRDPASLRVDRGAPTLYSSPAYSGESISNGLFDVRNYWVIFYKHRALILTVAAIVLAVTFYRIRTAPTTYVASTQIRIDPMGPQYINLRELVVPVVDSSYYETEYAVLRGSAIAKRVINRLKLYADERFFYQPQAEGRVAQLIGSAKAAASAVTMKVRSVVVGVPPTPPQETQVTAAEPTPERMKRLVDRYLSALTVTPATDSRLVKISFTSASPKLANEVAAAHAREFISMTLEARNNLTVEAQKFFEERLSDVKKKMEEAEDKLNAFRREHRVLAVAGGEKENVVLERLATLNSSYASAQAERIALEAEYDLVRKRQYDLLSAVQRDGTYNTLKEQLEQLRSEYGRLSQVYKPQYPKMVQLAGQISALEDRMHDVVRKAVAGVESRYLGAKQKEGALAAEVEKNREATLDLNDLNVQYQVLARDADANRDLYKKLLTRLKESSVAANVQTSNVTVVDPGEISSSAVAADFWRRLLTGAMMGLVLGFGLAFGLELLDRTLKTPEDAEAALHLPALAVIPSFSYENRLPYARKRLRFALSGRANRDGNVQSSELVASGSLNSVIAEAYRTLRTAVLLSSPDVPPRIVQIVSAQSREGKTVTAVNVAVTLAQSGARVLIIDGDLRKPRCNTIFDTAITPGLVDYLVGHSKFEACVRHLDLPWLRHGVPLSGENGGGVNGNGAGNGHGGDGIMLVSGSLDLMPAGTKAPNPAEMLGSRRMREMLELARKQYDYVIVDSPPLLPIADSVVLATMVDGVVLVIKGQATHTSLVRQALSKLDRVNARVLGTVINNVDVTSGDYYYYKGYYASYGYLDQPDERA